MRLIDADELRSAIREAAMESDVTVRDVLTTIDLFHTIDAELVIHGRWIKKWDYISNRYYHECSVCEHDALMKDVSMQGEFLSPFCPDCGALMGLTEECV